MINNLQSPEQLKQKLLEELLTDIVKNDDCTNLSFSLNPCIYLREILLRVALEWRMAMTVAGWQCAPGERARNREREKD